MLTEKLPFFVTNWNDVSPTEHAGTTGRATWKTQQLGSTRVRFVEYTPGYLADHWCRRGHVILVLEGELETELEDGRRFTLQAGMTYHVSNDTDAHRSSTKIGAKLFIVD